MPNYGDKRYWDKRYRSQETVFEWLENFNELRQFIDKDCKKEAKILNIGCGNSIIQEDMYDAGYTDIESIDISSTCIQQMIARRADRTGLVYKVRYPSFVIQGGLRFLRGSE